LASGGSNVFDIEHLRLSQGFSEDLFRVASLHDVETPPFPERTTKGLNTECVMAVA